MSSWFFPNDFHTLRGPSRYSFCINCSLELYAAYDSKCEKLGAVIYDVGGDRFACDFTGENIYTASFSSNKLARYQVNVPKRNLKELKSAYLEKPQRIQLLGESGLVFCSTESAGVHIFDGNLNLLCVIDDASDVFCDSKSGMLVVSGRGKGSNFQVFDEKVELLHSGSMPSFALAGIATTGEYVCVGFVGFGIVIMSQTGAVLFSLQVDRLVQIYSTRDSGIILLKFVSLECGVTELSYFDLKNRQTHSTGVIETLYLHIDRAGAFGLSDKGELFSLTNFQSELQFACP